MTVELHYLTALCLCTQWNIWVGCQWQCKRPLNRRPITSEYIGHMLQQNIAPANDNSNSK